MTATPVAVIALMGASLLACGPSADDGIQTGGASYRHTRSVGAWLRGEDGGYSFLRPLTREIWIGTDGSGRIMEQYQEPIFFSTRDREAWDSSGSGEESWQPCFDPGGLTYDLLDAYPRDPTALRAMLVERSTSESTGKYSAADFLEAVRAILWETVPPEDLSKAVLGAVNGQEGIEVRQGIRDRNGRPGIAFTAEDGRDRRTIILDTDTGRLLGEETVLLKPNAAVDAAPPIVIAYVTYLEADLVSSVPMEDCDPPL